MDATGIDVGNGCNKNMIKNNWNYVLTRGKCDKGKYTHATSPPSKIEFLFGNLLSLVLPHPSAILISCKRIGYRQQK